MNEITIKYKKATVENKWLWDEIKTMMKEHGYALVGDGMMLDTQEVDMAFKLLNREPE